MYILIYQSKFPAVRSYFERRFTSKMNDFIVLKESVEWQNDIIELIKKIQGEMTSENKNMLRLLAYAVEMAAIISENIKENGDNLDISVDDIAFSGGMCRSKCCRLFHQMIRQTPNAYLTHYRIARSCKLFYCCI